MITELLIDDLCVYQVGILF